MKVTLWTELNDQQAEIVAGGGQPANTGYGLITGLQASEGGNLNAFAWNNPNNPPPDAWNTAGFGTLNAPGQQ